MTPDEWLLAEFDRAAANPLRISQNHERPIFEVLEDHPSDGCRTTVSGRCFETSDYATWPEPGRWHDLDRWAA